VCRGQCEGTGMVPVKLREETDQRFVSLWHEAEAKEPTDDGWHFVRCPDCHGSGKKPLMAVVRDVPWYLRHHVFNYFLWNMVIKGGTPDMWKTHRLEHKPLARRWMAFKIWARCR
jgi:hypothetical protein